MNVEITLSQELEDQSKPTSFSTRIDWFLWLKSEELDEWCRNHGKQIDSTGKARRARDKSTQEKYLFSIKIILLNLLLLHKAGRGMWLAVPKAVAEYTNKNRFDHPLVSYKPFMSAYDGLKQLGYIEDRIGFFDKLRGKGKVTRIRPEYKLKQELDRIFPQTFIFFERSPFEDGIVLKNTSKKMMDYDDTDYTQSARNNLAIINQCLSRHWYDLDLSDDEFESLYKRIDERYEKDNANPAMLNLNDRSLYRVYNNGDKENQSHNFTQGGRFYGGWWQGIPSEYRQYITINQKYTVEVDYSNLHPAMMYAQKGLVLPDDAYKIEGVPEIKKNRKMVKVAFNKLINGEKQLKRPDDYNDEQMGLEWIELLSSIEKTHEPIKEHFRTGYGLFLQKTDSNIAEQVLFHFAKRNIPCLPIHDSFIVHYAHEDELKEVMLRVYKRAMGGFGNTLKIDDYFEVYTNRRADIIRREGSTWDSAGVDKLFSLSVMSQYDRRWYDWGNHINKE